MGWEGKGGSGGGCGVLESDVVVKGVVMVITTPRKPHDECFDPLVFLLPLSSLSASGSLFVSSRSRHFHERGPDP